MSENHQSLLEFSHTIFQQANITIQFNNQSNANSQPLLLNNHKFQIYIFIKSSESLKYDISIYLEKWSKVLSLLLIESRLTLCENLSTYFQVQILKPKQEVLEFIGYDDLKTSIIFSFPAIFDIPTEYFNKNFNFDIMLKLILPQELPFNEKLIPDPHERNIRLILDSNRHIPPKSPQRKISEKILVYSPLQIEITTKELNQESTLVTILLQNTAIDGLIFIEDIFIHIDQSVVDYERSSDRIPQSLDESFDMYSTTDMAFTQLSTSSSSQYLGFINNFFKIEFLNKGAEHFDLHPGDVKRVSYVISANSPCFFNYFKMYSLCNFLTPCAIHWIFSSKNLVSTSTISNFPFSWSFSTKEEIQRNFNSGLRDINESFSFSRVNCQNANMITVDVTYPEVVNFHTTFTFLLTLCNTTDFDLTNITLHTEYPESSSKKYTVSNLISLIPFKFKEKDIQIGDLSKGSQVKCELNCKALILGSVEFNKLFLSASYQPLSTPLLSSKPKNIQIMK